MLEVCFILPGPPKWASSRLRAIWISKYIDHSAVVQLGGEIPEAKAYIWIKTVHPQVFEGLRTQTGARQYWDLCDPVWWWEPQGVKWLAPKMDGVIASTRELADDFEENNGVKCGVIPDRLELEHYPIQKKHQRQTPIRFIWFGASQNRISLFAAAANLDRLVANGIPVELTIFDDQPGSVWQISDKFPIYYVNWALETENQVIASHDIALLPPYPGPWGKLKSNNKNLTAWACGLPTTDAQDYGKLLDLATLTGERERQAKQGMQLVKVEYDIRKSAREWEAVINAKA